MAPAPESFPVPAGGLVTSQNNKSQNNRYEFEFGPEDPLHNKRSRGRLYEVHGTDRRLVWEAELENAFSPRFALVNNKGLVATFDDWDNTPSQNAIVVFDKKGRTKVRLSIDQVASKLNVSLDDLISSASTSKCGWWLQAAPQLDVRGRVALLRVNNAVRKLNLKSGTLN